MDEGVPRQLVAALRRAGLDAHQFNPLWKGFANGKLIAVIENEGFDALVTNDKNIASQQSLRGRNVAVVALPINKRATIVSRLADIVDTLQRTTPGQPALIEYDGSRRAYGVGADGRSTVEDFPAVPPFR